MNSVLWLLCIAILWYKKPPLYQSLSYYFLIYINNDMPSVSALPTRLFADDANVTLFHKCANTLEEKMNYGLLKIDEWMKVNNYS